MTSTPDFSSDKEPLGHSASQGFDNQYPSNRYLSSQHTSRTREKYVGPVLGTQRIREQDKKRGCMPTDPKKRRWVFIGIPVALVVIAAIAVGVVVGVDQANKAKARSETGASGSGTTKGGGGGGGASTDTGTPGQDDTASNPYLMAGTGQAGSTVTTDLGAEFVYSNDFGGSWAQNPEDPYSVSLLVIACCCQPLTVIQVSGRAQDYTPSLTEEWVWGKDHARGYVIRPIANETS
jgi:glucan 1,3-beta-glucosidase